MNTPHFLSKDPFYRSTPAIACPTRYGRTWKGETFLQGCAMWSHNANAKSSILIPGQAATPRYRKIVMANFQGGNILSSVQPVVNTFHNTLLQRNEVFWTQLISRFVKCGKASEALRIYKEMREQGVTPKTYTFVAALKACSVVSDLGAGKNIHAHVTQSGCQRDIFVANTLVDMYAKCGSIVDARRVFEKMSHRNVVSWNAMIMGYAQRDEGQLALQLYARMQHEGFTPNARTFVAALKACSSLAVREWGEQVNSKLLKSGCLEKGRTIHSQVEVSGFETDIFVANTLVDMYAKCGSMMDAHRVFEKMQSRDVVSWTAMIMGYAQTEKAEFALHFYARMQHEGFIPNARTFVAVLKACSILAIQEEAKQVDGNCLKIGCLKTGRTIHSEVATNGFETDVFVANTLMDMYVKCGSMVDAGRIFEKMQQRNVASWTTMIIGHTQMEKGGLALQLYARMQQEGFIPDARTFVAALKACSSLAAQEEGNQVDGEFVKIRCLEKGRTIHSQVATSGFQSNIFVANTLLDMYAKCGSMVNALWVFEKMTHRDVVSWNTMIMGYAQMEKGEVALQFYAHMQHEGFTPDAYTFVAALKASRAVQGGKHDDGQLASRGCLERGRAIHAQVAKRGFESDLFIASTLVGMYMKCGSMMDARQVFERMTSRYLVPWNAMIMGYARMMEGELALQFFVRMQQEGFIPNARTFVAALMACSNLASLETGKETHAEICRFGLEAETFVANCLVNMYGKCGSMLDAQRLFDEFTARDVVTWSALIAGYSGQGDTNHVLTLFERMQQEGIQPVGVTFVSVLTVCSHTGLMDKGQRYFQAMSSVYGITPANEHYSCIVDLLSRAGQVDEAMAMMTKMPFQPNVVTWITFLGACRKWNILEAGRHAFECALRLDEKQTAAYALMTNIYTSAFMCEETAKIQETKMKQRPG